MMKLFGWYQQTSPIRAKVRRGAAGRDDACGAQWLKQSVGCKERVRTNRREITHIHRACFFSAILNATCIDSPAGLQRLAGQTNRHGVTLGALQYPQLCGSKGHKQHCEVHLTTQQLWDWSPLGKKKALQEGVTTLEQQPATTTSP